MSKIILVEPPHTNNTYGGFKNIAGVYHPLGLLLVAAKMRRDGHDVEILDCKVGGMSHDSARQYIISKKPDVVGFTAMTCSIESAQMLAQTVKSSCPKIHTILGGIHLISMPEETKTLFGDSIDEYETEYYDFSKCDTFPYPAWDLLPGFPGMYRQHSFQTPRTPWASMITSYGCNGKCIFCCSGSRKDRCHTHSAEYIFDMITELVRAYGIRDISFSDDNMTMYRNNTRKLCEMLINAKYDLTWFCNARVDRADRELLSLMKRAGCIRVGFGVESCNKKVLEIMRKGITREQIKSAITVAHEVGIRTTAYFIVGSFGETKKTIRDTSDFAVKLPIDDFRPSFFTPYPATQSWGTWREYGTFDPDWKKLNYMKPSFIPFGFTGKTLKSDYNRIINRMYFRPHIIWSHIKLMRNPVKFVMAAISYIKHLVI